MKKKIFGAFGGIAPRYAPGLKSGLAQTAENCDLSSGKIRPLPGPLAVGTGAGNSLHYHGGAWQSGTDRFFSSWPIGSTDLLLWLDTDGTPMKTVAGVSGVLGQVRPGAPTVEMMSPYVRFRWTPESLGNGTFYIDTTSGAIEKSGRLAFVRSEVHTDQYFAANYYDHDSDGGYAGISLGYYTLIVAGGISPGPPDSLFINDLEWTMGANGDLEPLEWVWQPYHSTYLSDAGDSLVYCKPVDLSPVSLDYEQVAWWDTHGVSEMLLVQNPGGVTDTVRYAISTVRSVGGHEDESGLGPVSGTVTALHGVVRVTRPVISDAAVTHWRIYRLGDLSGEYQFVAQVPVLTTYYDDALNAAEVGAAPTTFYTSDQGNEILFARPDEMDGLAGPHAGMMFGWRGNVLFWCEPGKPDAWPGYYSLNFPAAIRAAVPMAGALAVLTALGAFRVDGSHPELLQETESIGMEPCPTVCAAKTSRGVCYLSDTGIALFDLYRTVMVTDAMFTESWFAALVAASARMVESDGSLYLFHSAGALRVDMTAGEARYTTLDAVATAAFARPDDGRLYVISAGEILDLFGGSGVLAFTWRSGDVYGASDDHAFAAVKVTGSGAVTLSVYVDGVLARSRALDFAMDRGRTIGLRQEEAGRALWFELTGTGQVTEVEVI